MACRFPGAIASPDDLWALVSGERSVVGPLPSDRGWDLPLAPGTIGGFLADAAGFDAGLFGVASREAVAMDPQQRLLLEVAWEALERARVAPGSVAAAGAGAFFGVTAGDYWSLLERSPGDHDADLLIGAGAGGATGRVAFALGLEGPAVSVDTAASSSLVALHLAGQALRAGECSLALAGGAAVMATPSWFRGFAQQGALSASGRVRPFAAGADGTVWSEGVGVVVLERLSSALSAGRPVWAVVRGSAVNQDGTSSSPTAPRGAAQEAVIRRALAAAGLAPADVDAVEGHGTGTPVGDPVEARAVLATYGQDRSAPLSLGSVKGHLGHTQAASGVAGVITSVLALHHAELPATLHADAPTPEVDWSSGAVELRTEPHLWPGPTRRVGVSSFGITGTNAHVVLEAAPERGRELPRSRAGSSAAPPLVLSAASRVALQAVAARLGPVVGAEGWVDVAGSLVTTRAALKHRAVALTPDGLKALAEGRRSDDTVAGTATGGVAFVFSGQGAQYAGMGAELHERFPAYARAFDDVCARLGDGVRERVLGGEPLDDTRWAQTALFAVGYALAQLLADLGVRPDVVAGHSVGELVAAHVAGVLSLDDACRLVAARARLMGELPAGGAMAVVTMAEEQVAAEHPDLSVAAVNGPDSVVVSGPEAAVARIGGRRLRVSHAFHSSLVEPMLAPYAEVAATVDHQPPTIPLVSTLTGAVVTDVTARHWVDQARHTVRYADAVRALGDVTVLEVGPGRLADVAVLGRAADPTRQLLTALAHVWVGGGAVDWAAVVGDHRPVDLPTYPFEHQRFWPGDTAVTPPAPGPTGDQLTLVRTEAATVLGLSGPDAVDPARTFRDLGFESRDAVELRLGLQAATGRPLPSTVVFDHPTCTALAAWLDAAAPAPAPAPAPAGPDRAPVTDEPLAIVGMACRFPGGVASPDDLWALVAGGGDAIAGFPTDRGWEVGPGSNGSFPRLGGFLAGATGFDAGLFGISPREAVAMDPQQRLFLEVCWEALEHAGLDPLSRRGTDTGVFAGLMANDYGRLLPPDAEGYGLTGVTGSVVSGRVAYALGLEGPALSVDTACSSSLVALHQAGQALRAGECSLALAGGVTVMATPSLFVEFAAQGGLAADGRCKAFGASADGTGWAEGVGVLVVERLSDARRHDRHIWGLVRGSAVNQDGASNGLTAPNGGAQQRVIRRALASAGLRPGDVDVVEAHGTGTTLGDPIEASALLATYGQDRSSPVWLGSVKSNIGHTQAAAGVAGIIKMLMAMHHGVLPATLHAEEPSPHVDWSSGSVELLTEAQPWPGPARRSAVSSFGISGTNAHVILENIEPAPETGTLLPVSGAGSVGITPLVVSAASPETLQAQARQLIPVLQDNDMEDVAGALATSRAALDHRAAVVVADRDDAVAGLESLAAGASAPQLVSGAVVRGGVVFVFPGQGAQWVGMGAGLMDLPVFREAVGECEAALAPYVDWSLTEVVAGGGDGWLARVDVVQPALFATMVALARVWESFGVTPAAVVGHSQGEIAAAHVAGALSLDDAARIVVLRAQLVAARLAGAGGMASITADESRARGLLDRWAPGVTVATLNGPASVTVAGRPDDLDRLLAACEAEGVRSARVAVDYASHSPQVEAIRDELEAALVGIVPRSGRVPFCSTLTGTVVDTATLDAGYWYRNLRETGRFADAVRTLADRGHGLFVEVSPHPMLLPPVQGTLDDAGPTKVALGTLRRGAGDRRRLVEALAEAWVHGAAVDWRRWLAPARQVDLPTYPFRHRRFWPAPVDPGPTPELLVPAWEPAAAGPPADIPDDIVIWAAAPGRAEARVAEALERVQGWSGDERSAGARMVVVTHGAATLTGDRPDATTLSAAAVAALFRSAQSEDPDRFILVDLEAPPIGGAVAQRPGADRRQERRHAGLDLSAAKRRERAGVTYPRTHLGATDPDIGVAVRLALAAGEPEVAVRGGRAHVRRLAEVAGGGGDRAFAGEGTVLVTGGTGTLGAALARHLVAAHGVRSLLLAGRRGGAAPGVEALVDELTAAGAEVAVAACDVGDRAAVGELLASVPDGRPLRGIVHAAGTLDDGLVASLTPEQCAAVWGPKALGAWHLHELTLDLDLTAFVVFSSTAGLLGAAGQANYAAASAFADALVEHRRSLGRPGVSVAWGLWAEASGLTGAMAAADRARMRRSGIVPLGTDDALRLFDAALGGPPVVAALGLDRASLRSAGALPVWRRLVGSPAPALVGGDDEPDGPALVRRLAGTGEAERRRVLTDVVRSEAATVLGHPGPEAVDPGRAFKDMGFDSLTAVDLRNRLAALTGLRLPTTLVFDHPTVDRLAADIDGRLAPPGLPAADDPAVLLARLEGAVRSAAVDPEVLARLRRLLTAVAARVDAGDDDGGAPPVEDELAEAGAQEVLDFIDREFGEAVG